MFYKRNRFFAGSLAMAAIVLLSACRQIDLHESHATFKNFEWYENAPATGKFRITDTTAAYRLFVVLRHQDAYPFNNIWLNMGINAPGDTARLQRIEVPLGSDATGWYGAGMGNIWETRYELTTGPQRFRKPGVYQYRLGHIMRVNPLPHVMSVGLRVEKLPG